MTEFIWVKDIRQHPQYYIKMFGDRNITNALGVANHHDDSEEWLVAVQNGELLGFSGYEITGSTFILKRSYVFPKYRMLGIYGRMVDARLSKAVNIDKIKVIQATCTYMSRHQFEKRNFKAIKYFKKYTTYRIIL